MITKEELIEMNGAGTICHVTLKDSRGNPVKARLNGKLRVWKRRSEVFRQPAVHGLRNYFYISEENCHEWTKQIE